MHIQESKDSEKENDDNVIHTNGFSTAIKYLSFFCFLGVITQNFYDRTGQVDEFNLFGFGVSALIFIIFIAIWGKRILRIIDTPYFATSAILLIAAGTAMGTFIGQNMAYDAFQYRYGQTLAGILSFLQLDDVFHSWWYVLLFILLSISLVKISIRRPFSIPNLGFYLAHLSPLIILLGFWWDYYAGFRGLMQLVTGNSSNIVNVYYSNTNRVIDTVELDFQIKLDYFKSEKFDPDHRIHIWESNLSPDGNSNSRIVASLPIEIDKKNRIYGTDISFELKEFYPNFYLEYTFPEGMDTIEAKDPGILIELINPHGSNMFQLRARNPNQYRFDDPILGVLFEFYWTLPQLLREEISSDDREARAGIKPRFIFSGKEKVLYKITADSIVSSPINLEEEVQIPGKNMSRFKIISIFPDASKLISTPSTRDEKQLNPVARLLVYNVNGEDPEEAFIYPQNRGEGGQYYVNGTPFILALESIKDRETKFWESGLSVLSPDGNVVKQQEIVVNKPLSYSGYKFYQSDYDPNNPNYSGIGVSYTPGLKLVYFGFYLMVGGIMLLFYFKVKEEMPSVI